MFFNPTLTSGIPRVVKNIVAHANASNPEIECIPVFYRSNSAYKVKKPVPGRLELIFAKAQGGFHKLFEKLELKHNFLLGASANSKSKAVNYVKITFVKGVIFLIRVARFISKVIRTFIAGVDRGDRIDFCDDDVIIMLDASWQKDTENCVGIAKSRGNKVVCVIHDLIPVTHPQLFDDKLVKNYNLWLDWVIRTADGFLAVSKSSRDQAKVVLRERLSHKDYAERWFDYFYLGSELNLVPGLVVRDRIKSIFSGSQPVYLMVSTIEPRKNHQYLLDAFTELWHEGKDVVLCFVGRVGWKCESLLKRVYSHSELNKRLFMLNDMNDMELEYAYQHSKALVFSSIAEGFGLPVVEAMQRGLPVMASDIPVFNEVGGDYCAYFDLNDHHSLCQLIIQFEATGVFPAVKPLTGYGWLTWQQATDFFVQKVSDHIAIANEQQQ